MQGVVRLCFVNSLSIARTTAPKPQLDRISIYPGVYACLRNTSVNNTFHITPLTTNNSASHLKLLIVVNLDLVSASELRIVEGIISFELERLGVSLEV